MKKSMSTRIVLGLIMVAGVIGVFWLDYTLGQGKEALLPLTALLGVIAVLAVRELNTMARAAGGSVLLVTGLAGILLIMVLPAYRNSLGLDAVRACAIVGLTVSAIFAEQMVRHRTSDAIKRIGFTSLAVLYLGVGLALVLLIREAYGLSTLVLFLAAVKATDVGAYFTGSAFGKHKMIPWLSPGKSWEGLAGGLVFAAGVAVLLKWGLDVPFFGKHLSDGATLAKTVLFGAAVGAAGQFADLCESLLKRSVNLKDSGALVPEFGGILDIIDSPLLAAPVAILLLAFL